MPANEWCLEWASREVPDKVLWPTEEDLHEVFALLKRHPLRLNRWAGVFGGRVYHCKDDKIIFTDPPVDDLDDPATQTRLWGEMRASLEVDPDEPLPAVHILHGGYPLCGFSTSLPTYWPQGQKWVPFDNPAGATCIPCCEEIKKG
jgi:hypothetical protein